jgi:hypothetical protein
VRTFDNQARRFVAAWMTCHYIGAHTVLSTSPDTWRLYRMLCRCPEEGFGYACGRDNVSDFSAAAARLKRCPFKSHPRLPPDDCDLEVTCSAALSKRPATRMRYLAPFVSELTACCSSSLGMASVDRREIESRYFDRAKNRHLSLALLCCRYLSERSDHPWFSLPDRWDS